MKSIFLVAAAMLVPIAAQAQDQSSCKAFFQVLHAEAGTPGLHAGLDPAQKKWWENKGQKKYPGLCLNGVETSADKPRFLVIWSKSKTIGQTSPALSDVFGQAPNTLQTTAPAENIYQARWDQASVTILNILNDGSLMLPPVYFETDQHVWIFVPSSRKVLETAVKYLSQERVFLPESN